jgi:hypothetical protein
MKLNFERNDCGLGLGTRLAAGIRGQVDVRRGDGEPLVDKRQPPSRRRMLKAGKILLGTHPITCTIRNISEKGACLQVQTSAGIPSVFDFLTSGEPTRTCKTIWRDDTQIGVMFIQRE